MRLRGERELPVARRATVPVPTRATWRRSGRRVPCFASILLSGWMVCVYLRVHVCVCVWAGVWVCVRAWAGVWVWVWVCLCVCVFPSLKTVF